jgi:two-component system phosphate regulon response regulator OmpR
MEDALPRVLLVDDDVRLRELLLRYLASQGFDVRGVGDGAQLRQALDRGHFDLIVLDLMLPGDNGLDICRRLRGQGDATPIVMLTAKGDEIDRIVGLEIGADDYVPKPVNPRELLARIRSVLLRHPRQPLSRDRLMSLARGREHEAFERSMDVTIARLRRLLEEDPRQPRLIQTVWGVGYVFVPPEAAA